MTYFFNDEADGDIADQPTMPLPRITDSGHVAHYNHCDECGCVLDAFETHYDGKQVLCRPCSDRIPCTAIGCSWHPAE